jgi:hypothetical protein
MSRRGIYIAIHVYGWWIVLGMIFVPLILLPRPIGVPLFLAGCVIGLFFLFLRVVLGNDLQRMDDRTLAEALRAFLEPNERVMTAAVANWRLIVARSDRRLFVIRLSAWSGRPETLTLAVPLTDVRVLRMRRRPFSDLIVLKLARGKRLSLAFVSRSRAKAPSLVADIQSPPG